MLKQSALLALLSASYGWAQNDCKLEDDFTIQEPRLYPENVAFDPDRCCLYFSNVYDATVSVYDIKQKKVTKKIGTAPDRNISGNPLIHASGVRYRNNTLAGVFNTGAAFDSQGARTEGANWIYSYDLEREKFNILVDISQHTQSGLRGFQDVDFDKDGNLLAVGTWGGSLVKVSGPNGSVESWWNSAAPAPAKGLTGAAKFNESTLLIPDENDGQLWCYSMEEKGKRERVRLADGTNLTGNLDGVFLPPRFDRNVLLVSDNMNGTLVFRTGDQWQSAERLGAVPIPDEISRDQGFATASFEINGRIFVNYEFLLDNFDEKNGIGKAGNRSVFPFQDITDQVARLVGESSANPTSTGSSGGNPWTSSVLATGGSAKRAVSWAVLGAAAGALAFVY